jgi:hypothetical protein
MYRKTGQRRGAAKSMTLRSTLGSTPEPTVRQQVHDDLTYFVGSIDRTGLVKIGRTINLDRRFEELQSHSPVTLSVWRAIPGGDLEFEFHELFAACRKHNEWFDVAYSDVMNLKVTYPTPTLVHVRLDGLSVSGKAVTQASGKVFVEVGDANPKR